MSAGTNPSPTVALIELRAHTSAGAGMSTSEAVRLTEVLRGTFATWSDAAESAHELTILLMREKLEPWQQTYALNLLDRIERALQRKDG